jgi:3-phenylpropionate/trans-cinnamate dioxygenase ferredoxin reductase component
VETILVIGAGQAGGRAAQTLREKGFAGRLILAGSEIHRPYERPTLSKSVLTEVDDSTCFNAWLHGQSFYTDHDIEWWSDPVIELNAHGRHARFASGESVQFSKCLLATGGSARLLDRMPDSPHVFVLRTLDDAMRLRERIGNARRVAIVGGGFLGLEFAASARARGLEVTVIEAGTHLLGRALPSDFATTLQAKHEAHGVTFLMGTSLSQCTAHEDGLTLSLANHLVINTDFCVVAIGQIPNDELARAAGLATSNGIDVDAFCRTSAADVYAAGDCANFPQVNGQRLRLESWQNAQEQAVTAATNMLGGIVEYRPAPWFWTDQYDWNIQMLGLLDSSIDTWIDRSSSVDKRLLIGLAAGVIRYALAVNNGGELRALRSLVQRGVVVDPVMLADPAIKLRQYEKLLQSEHL